MKVSEALKVFGLENGKGVNLLTVGKLFRQLSLIHHPDHGGKKEQMVLLLESRDCLLKMLRENPEYVEKTSCSDYNLSELFEEIMQKLMPFDGLEIEACGTWLWVRGKTKPIAKQLGKNGVGLRFSRDKAAWYWKPPQEKGRRWKGKPKDMDSIRNKYGSQKFTSTGAARIQ